MSISMGGPEGGCKIQKKNLFCLPVPSGSRSSLQDHPDQGPTIGQQQRPSRETVRVDPIDRAPVYRTQVQNSRLLPLYTMWATNSLALG